MNEPYPKNILSQLTRSSNLSTQNISALMDILQIEDIKTCIEQSYIDPIVLFCKNEGGNGFTTLSPQDIRQLVTLYHAIKTHAVISSQHIKLSDFIFWFTYKNQAYAYTPLPNIANLLIKSPEKISTLREFIQKNSEAMKLWLDIGREVSALNGYKTKTSE